MFIAVKNKKIIAIHEADWQCRMKAKGLSKPEYWAWLETVTTDGVSDYSSEDYEIVETEVDIREFSISGHITTGSVGEGT